MRPPMLAGPIGRQANSLARLAGALPSWAWPASGRARRKRMAGSSRIARMKHLDNVASLAGSFVLRSREVSNRLPAHRLCDNDPQTGSLGRVHSSLWWRREQLRKEPIMGRLLIAVGLALIL